jgi:hypothetical protein
LFASNFCATCTCPGVN